MNSCLPPFEPAATTTGKSQWLRHFGKAEQPLIEAPCHILQPRRHGQLDMVERHDLTGGFGALG
ncbi:hypothetical protein AC244_24730 [Ensifer adhaerens]|uniref:Uncharacterized protein n=1 Tax=Ensifer adhaerens TaxID=106592 RepID=A0A0L8BK73_ENSAD|nr:hypothetical protein AC244_24730 [Ensifer adhaerens]